MKIKEVLIFGAGAVGRVVGAHLRLTGLNVSFFVRPQHQDALKKTGINLYNLKHRTEMRLSAPQLITELPEDKEFDLVVLAVRSDQLEHAIETLKPYYENKEGIIVSLQPGRKDMIKLLDAFPHIVIVPGEPGFAAYLEADRVEYQHRGWLPTLIGAPLNETLHIRNAIVALFNEGGIPTKGVNDIEAEIRVPFSAGMPLLAAFNLSHYSFKALRDNPKLLSLTAQAMREAVQIIKKETGFIPVKYKLFEHINPKMLSSILYTLENFAPVSMRKMWDLHARKIEDQTYQMLDDLVELGERHFKGKNTDALSTLAALTPQTANDYLSSHKIKALPSKGNTKFAGVALGMGLLFVFYKTILKSK